MKILDILMSFLLTKVMLALLVLSPSDIDKALMVGLAATFSPEVVVIFKGIEVAAAAASKLGGLIDWAVEKVVIPEIDELAAEAPAEAA